MSQIKIPLQYEAGLAKALSLSEDAMLSLISSLGESSSSLRPKTVVSKVSQSVKHISESDIEPIVNTITSLYLARANMEMSVSEFADSIIEALDESDSVLVEVSSENRERLKNRLEALLNVESLKVRAKALEVLHEHEHALSRVRVMTDIRPVFGPNADDSPIAAVVVHMLKLTYLEDSKFKDFFVALDNDDLKLIKEALDRAEKKAQSLKSLLSLVPVSYIDSE